MSRLLIVEPMAPVAVVASRGSDAAALQSFDPKEVWVDSATGVSTLTVDLGTVRTVDTIFLGHLRGAVAGSSWTIASADAGGGLAQAASPLRVPDVAGDFATVSHALWTGSPFAARLIRLTLDQPAGAAPLSAGTLVIGRSFVAELGPEWGAGRQPIDTGSATSLPSGGFAIVEGIRKRRFAWTFGDLSPAEADQLELIALALGETRPCLVVEDADRTAGLHARIHYAKFERWRSYERRNRRQTRWELAIEEWA